MIDESASIKLVQISPLSVKSLTGAANGLAPFLEEQIAIEASNALRSAEIGIRGMRSRSLLRRFWEGVTGQGQERTGAICQDLVVAQRATQGALKILMNEEIRTKKCVNQVIHNLLSINEEMDLLQTDVASIREDLLMLRHEMAVGFRALADEIQKAKELAIYLSGREGELRRLERFYLAGDLHPGSGQLLGSSLYLAISVRHFLGDGSQQVMSKETSSAAATTKTILSKKALRIDELLFMTLNEIAEGGPAENQLFLAEGGNGPISAALRSLLERKAVGLPVGQKEVDEAIEVARTLRDPDAQLKPILYPVDYVKKLARELEPSVVIE